MGRQCSTGPMQKPRPAPSRRPVTGISALATLWVTFEGDKAREVTHDLDVLTVLQQVGALPG